MKQYYKVYASEHNIIDVQADKFNLDENTLEFFNVNDKRYEETIAVFNINNILGFKKVTVAG